MKVARSALLLSMLLACPLCGVDIEAHTIATRAISRDKVERVGWDCPKRDGYYTLTRDGSITHNSTTYGRSASLQRVPASDREQPDAGQDPKEASTRG